MRVANKQTETKQAERTIHYVGIVNDSDDVTQGQELKEPTTQKVTLTGTYYTDHDGNRVNTKTVTINGQQYDVVVEPTAENPAKETWIIDGEHSGVTENNGKYEFAKADTPDTIGESNDQWQHKVTLDKNTGVVAVDPTGMEWPKNNTLPDGYVVYMQLPQPTQPTHCLLYTSPSPRD